MSSLIQFLYRATHYHPATKMVSISKFWTRRLVKFSRPNDYFTIRNELDLLYPNDPHITEGILLHSELCGIRILGIRIL